MIKVTDEDVERARTAYRAAVKNSEEYCPRCRGTGRDRDNYTECGLCEGRKFVWKEESIDPVRAALESFATSLPAARVPDMKSMVERFLGWRLPKDFAPDGGVSFERHYTTLVKGKVKKKEREPNSPWWPVGTNLLTAEQAEQMFSYVLAAAPQAGETK